MREFYESKHHILIVFSKVAYVEPSVAAIAIHLVGLQDPVVLDNEEAPAFISSLKRWLSRNASVRENM